jgi:hypothetical protein
MESEEFKKSADCTVSAAAKPRLDFLYSLDSFDYSPGRTED